MHSSAFIFTVLPAAVLAVLPNNITYPRHVLHKGNFTLPSDSPVAKPIVSFDAYPGAFIGVASICTQPVVTVTATVTSATSCGGKPSHTIVVFDDGKYDRPGISKTAAVAITATAPWPVSASGIVTGVNSGNSFQIPTTQHINKWAETYSASTATIKLNTTSISGIFVNPALLTQTHHADKTRTSTLVGFYTKTKVPAHTAVPAPSETDASSSNDNTDVDDEDEEDFYEDPEDDAEKTASVKFHETKQVSATAAITGAPKSLKTTDQKKHTSSSTKKPTAKPEPTGRQSTAKNFTALTLSASTASTLPKSSQSKTKATSPAEKTETSPKHSATTTSQAYLQPEDLFTDIPVPTLPYSKTYVAQFPLSSLTLSYKPAHHGHISVASPLVTTKTDDRLDSLSATVT
ncbi:hypothetical protein P171DRAFT_509668 [Karstenula rhodostoma CBS 690.94]|uniref:Uncharacterized protein n=1 Tax=Karstenula rhodostoma CBS 690.94 TaxID=1392251 RepID=A0A9P4UEF6_9PLEO|nr:hypothetical protein P171DRAFT_509668 [Karstenula rhodostoma CBS 690.94]